MDWGMVLAAAGVGIVVGLTGMGGGALMTPMLVLLFGVPPLTAVSSDLITSAVMKPVGSLVHMRQSTVNWNIVLWLTVGSVPSAFAGVLLVRAFVGLADLDVVVKQVLGVALVIAAGSLVLRTYLASRGRDASDSQTGELSPSIVVRPVPTVVTGVVGGLMVGTTSVGSGSLIIISLMFLYPMLTANRLVGTDLVQAVPLVISAAIGHLLFGEVDWSIAIPLTVGSIPGAFIGAQLSSRIGGRFIRQALILVLVFSGLRMLGVGAGWTLTIVIALLAVEVTLWLRVHSTAARRSLSPDRASPLEEQDPA